MIRHKISFQQPSDKELDITDNMIIIIGYFNERSFEYCSRWGGPYLRRKEPREPA